jgi:hypothetical protein
LTAVQDWPELTKGKHYRTNGAPLCRATDNLEASAFGVLDRRQETPSPGMISG